MTTLILFSAAMGWCGTPYPGWWWAFFRWRRPSPPPPPDPYRAFSNPMPGILAIIGGIAAGYGMHAVMPEEGYAAVGLAAFAGGRILSDIGGLFTQK